MRTSLLPSCWIPAFAFLMMALPATADVEERSPAPLTSSATAAAPGDSVAADSADVEPELDLDLGGALRFNVLFEEFDRTNRQKTGEFTFDTFRVNADGTYGDLFFSAEYRFYAGYRFLHSGYAGYEVEDDLDVRVGVHQVPFGVQPYFSNSWFFNLAYYAGFEDDYDAGLKVRYTPGNWTLIGAYYMNAEQTGFAGGTTFARYSFDVVPATTDDLGYAGLEADRFNQEINQFNGKVAYTLEAGGTSTTVSMSGQTGQLYNRSTTGTERHWATSFDLDGQYGRFNVRLGLIRYEMRPPGETGPGRDAVVMAAYNAPYRVASKGRFYSGGLAYNLPVDLGPISRFRFYNDVSYHDKAPDAWVDGASNITGVLTSAGPLFIYTDFLVTRNHPFSLPASDFGSALAEGSEEWNVAFNMNLGLYF